MNLRDETVLQIARSIYNNQAKPWKFSKLHKVLVDLGYDISKDETENIGVGKILSSVWRQCAAKNDKDAVATAFVDRNGNYAWK